VPRKNERQKKAGLLNWEIDALSAEPSEQVRRNGKITRVMIATGSTMVLDSSGTCNGERRIAVEMRSSMLRECMTGTRSKFADDLSMLFGVCR
jgi:hypothetical protein